MFTSENDSRLANAVCETSVPTCRPSHRRLRRDRDDDRAKPSSGNEPETADAAVDDLCRRRFSRTRSASSTVSSASSSRSDARRKRKKKHKHHHRHRSNRANDVYQLAEAASPAPPKPTVNPIFVWIKQDDTRIVQVLCEDYDRRNRIRLTKTAAGWRSIPLTESLEKRWHAFASRADATESPLVKNAPSDNPPQTDNLSSSPSRGAASGEDVNPRLCEQHPTDRSNLPADAFNSDDSNQEDLRSIIDKVQTESLYTDDESGHRTRQSRDSDDNENSPAAGDSDASRIADSNLSDTVQLQPNMDNHSRDPSPLMSPVAFDRGNESSDHEPVQDLPTKPSPNIVGEIVETAPSNVEQNSAAIAATPSASVEQNVEDSPDQVDCDSVRLFDESNSAHSATIVSPADRLPIKIEKAEADSSRSVATAKSPAPNLSSTERPTSSRNDEDDGDHGRENHVASNITTNSAVSAYSAVDVKSIDLLAAGNERERVVSTNSLAGDVRSSVATNAACADGKAVDDTKLCNSEFVARVEPIVCVSEAETDTTLVEPVAIELELPTGITELEKQMQAIESTAAAKNESRCDQTTDADAVKVGAPKCISGRTTISQVQLSTSDPSEIYPADDENTSNLSVTCPLSEMNALESQCRQKHPQLQHPDYEDTAIKAEKHDLDYEYESHHEPGAPQLLRTPLCQTLKTNKPSSACRRSQPIAKKQPHFKNEPLPAHMHSVGSQPHFEVGHDSTSGFGNQEEPLDLGTNCRLKLAQPVEKKAEPVAVKIPTSPLISPPMCRKRPSVGEKDIDDRRALKKSRLLDLLTAKSSQEFRAHEGAPGDPLEQLKNVLANPKYSVPDPLLVPKARLSALVTCPGKEIPRLLARRAQDLSYFSILSDPDVLVVSLSHLQSLLKKPINEEEILKYQKQTEEIRSRLRQECFNNNYENMALGNWNQCYWLPSFQRSDVITSCDPVVPPDLLSVLNIGFPSPASSCCRDDSPTLPTPPNPAFDYRKRLQYQKEATLWQELAALHQLSTSSPFDHFNNNTIPAGCDLGKDVCDLMWNHPDLCTNYGCYPSPNTPPARNNSNLVKTNGGASKFYPCDSQRKLSIPFLPQMQCNAQSFELNEQPHSFDPLLAEYYASANLDQALECGLSAAETKFVDQYESLRQMLNSSSENADLLQQLKMQQQQQKQSQPQTFAEEKAHIKEEIRDARPPPTSRVKEVKAETKPTRPLVPKIKVRKHLVDPNQRPTRLLNTDNHIFHNQSYTMAAAAHTINDGSHLWHPLFDSSVGRNYKKLQWTTPATTSGR